jgi:hypothetical protein
MGSTLPCNGHGLKETGRFAFNRNKYRGAGVDTDNSLVLVENHRGLIFEDRKILRQTGYCVENAKSTLPGAPLPL